MKKAILLVRVSTEKQNFDEQEKQLYNMAITDGFKDNEIIPIAEKESGIKLSEDERKGLNRLKEEISKGGVNTVYVWEVSRIGRKKKVIFSIVELLQQHKIQLVVKEPFIKLLNDDGSINDGAETILTLFAQMAESEMRNKQARWQRTRRANALKGKWNGGKNIKYGYSLDADNYYIINEYEANIVREIYHLYTDDSLSQRDIVKEYKSRGIVLSNDRVRRILQDKGYTGEEYTTTVYKNGKRCKGQTIKYPQIISKEQYEAVKNKRAKANITVARGENYYFGRQLITCPECGHSFLPYKVNSIYCCLAYKHDNHDLAKCYNTVTIGINALDTILWYDAKGEYINYLNTARSKDKKQYTERIEVLRQKITQCENVISSASAKMEKVADMYVEGVYSKEKYKTEIAKIKTSTAEEENNRITYQNEIAKINDLLENIGNEDVTDKYINSLAMANEIKNYKEMYDIVHRFISSVELYFVEPLQGFKSNCKRTKWRKIVINHFDGEKTIYYVNQWGEKINYYTEPSVLIGISKDEAIEKGIYYIEITDSVQPIKRELGRKKKN